MEMLSKLMAFIVRAKQATHVFYILLKGGDGMEFMFAYLIQLGEMSIDDVVAGFPAYYDRTVAKLKAMGFDEKGQLLG